MKLIGIHKVLKFKQSDRLKKNTLILLLVKQKNAVNSFEKVYFKLMKSSVYDKTMKNLRQTVTVRLVNLN